MAIWLVLMRASLRAGRGQSATSERLTDLESDAVQVSVMETDATRDALAAQLREIERGQAAPWVSYPPDGLVVAARRSGCGRRPTPSTLGLLDGAAEVARPGSSTSLVMLAAVWWMRRVRGTYPSGRSPRELNRPFALLAVGAAVVALAVWGACTRGRDRGRRAAVGLVLAWALVAAYEQAYAAAAARVRERLG